MPQITQEEFVLSNSNQKRGDTLSGVSKYRKETEKNKVILGVDAIHHFIHLLPDEYQKNEV